MQRGASITSGRWSPRSLFVPEALGTQRSKLKPAFVTFRTTKRAYAALKTFKAKRKFVNTIVGPEVQRAPRPRNIASDPQPVGTSRLLTVDMAKPR